MPAVKPGASVYAASPETVTDSWIEVTRNVSRSVSVTASPSGGALEMLSTKVLKSSIGGPSLISLRTPQPTRALRVVSIKLFAKCASGLREIDRLYAGVPMVADLVFDQQPAQNTTVTVAVEVEGRKLKLVARRDPDEPRRYTSEVFTTTLPAKAALKPDEVFDPPPPPPPGGGDGK